MYDNYITPRYLFLQINKQRWRVAGNYVHIYQETDMCVQMRVCVVKRLELPACFCVTQSGCINTPFFVYHSIKPLYSQSNTQNRGYINLKLIMTLTVLQHGNFHDYQFPRTFTRRVEIKIVKHITQNVPVCETVFVNISVT